MAGRKFFSNLSQYPLAVTLAIRRSEDPRDQAGMKDFSLPPHGQSWQDYGNNIDIYLNGINLIALSNGAMLGQQYVVITRGSALDNELNRFNAVDFNFAHNTFYVSTRQVY